MKEQAKIFKVLKWIFTIGMILLGMALVAFIAVEIILRIPSVANMVEVTTKANLSISAAEAVKIFITPFFILGFLVNLLVFAGVFFYGRKFFSNLDDGKIFVEENISSAKKISILFVILTFTSELPNLLIIDFQPKTELDLSMNFTYLLVALIIWALAKILEEAKAIADENQFTI